MAAVSLFTAACVEEVPYEPGQPEVDGCYGVYFPAQESDFVVDPADDPVQTLTAKRTNPAGEITVPVEVVTNVEGVLEIAPITFADGQEETTFTVSYKTAEPGTTYTASISITDPQYASKYNNGPVAIDFSVIKEKWVSLGEATYNDDWMEIYVKTEILQNELEPTRFRIMDPYGPFWESEGYTPKDAPAPYFEIEVLKVGQVLWPGKDYETKITLPDLIMYDPIGTGYYDTTNGGTHYYYHPNNFSSTSAESAWTYNCVLGYQENGLPNAFQIAPFPYMDGVGGWNYSTEPLVTIILPGAVLVDYSLEVEADYAVEGVTPLEFEAGADVAKVSYVVVEGEANPVVRDEQIAALAADKAENALTITAAEMVADEESGKLYAYADVTCPKTGVYTVIAVAFDAEGGAQTAAYDVFDYVAATDDTYDVEFSVEVTDTPARFAEDKHTVYNSFSFTVYGGNDLTDVKIGVYPSKDVEEYGMDAIVSDLRYEDEETNTSVLPDTLAMINTTAGYTDLYTGLKDGTAYTLVVWGTNGMQTKVVAAEYTTTKNPEVFKSLGKATYTDDIVGPLFEADPVTYEVEIEESQDNPGKYRLKNPYGEVYPYNEEGDWDAENDYYLVIDATDPEYVTIGEQDLGVDWGYGMMGVIGGAEYFIAAGQATEDVMKEAGYYGTLKDGVITFNPKTLFVYDADGMYYANTNGAFKVVLPSAATGDSTEGGSAAASVSKASVKSNATDFRLHMSKGRRAGVQMEAKTRTVAVTATVSARLPEKTSIDRNAAIATFDNRIN